MFHDVFIMFPRFVEENIAWGHASATHAEVEAAAKVGLQINLQPTWIDAMDGSMAPPGCAGCWLHWRVASGVEKLGDFLGLNRCQRCHILLGSSLCPEMMIFQTCAVACRFSWKKSPTNWFDLIPLRYGLADQGYDTLCADDKLLSGGQRFGFPTCTGFRLDFVRSATKNRPGTSFTTRPCS